MVENCAYIDEEWVKNDLLLDMGPYIENDLDQSQYFMNLFDAVQDISGADGYYAFPYALVTTVPYYNV